MIAASNSDRSHESIINAALARLLRELVGLDAVAETLHPGRRPDILARLPAGPAVLEVEIAPAPTVDADALSRLGMEIDGSSIQTAFAVVVPASIRATPQQHLDARLASAALQWQEWRADGSAGPKLAGGVAELAAAVTRATPPAGNLEAAVALLDDGARRAGSRLARSPGTLARVARVFGAAGASAESANMAALVIINAMAFQERLASADALYQPVSAARSGGIFSRLRLLQMWEAILSVDYYPIFHMAKQVVAELSDIEADGVLSACAQTAADLLAMRALGRHDLAGRIFNRLIAERKLLAAYYTSIPSSTLLAGLALAPQRWPGLAWNQVDALSQFRLVDPACGTGTLLMAAYRRILQNCAAGGAAADHPGLHQALLERIIIGTDVVPAAIHLTAATLAAMSPSVRFERMQLHTLMYGVDEISGGAHFGSIDWLKAPEAQSSFSATREQIGAAGGIGSVVQRPNADLVISNPPYTRSGNDGGKDEAALASVFSLPPEDAATLQHMIAHISNLLRGTPANKIAGHGSSFTVLADRMVKPGGRIALVLPATALSGQSWRGIRRMLAEGYDIEFVVSSQDSDLRSMSYDTHIAETLLVARKLNNDETPSGRGRFVNLWRGLHRDTDALAAVSAVNTAAAAPSLRADGPPVGGTPLFIGGAQWGEIVDGPVGALPWAAARWKHALTAQFAAALARGEIWTADGSGIAGQIPIAPLGQVCTVGPEDRAIHGPYGVFDSHRGRNDQAQYPAIWPQSAAVHQSVTAHPNAWLLPRPGRDHQPLWERAGRLHLTRSVRYNSQRVMAAMTDFRVLGVNSWYTMQVLDDDPSSRHAREIALALWCNSTPGMLLHASHSNRTQYGRGIGNKGMLETLATLDVRQLAAWQLDAAQAIYRDFRPRQFQPCHHCAVDPARIALDARLLGDLLGLDDAARATVSRWRALLAAEPSIHGTKPPRLPSDPGLQ